MSGNNNKERSSDESSNNVIKHFADASFLFAFNDDNIWRLEHILKPEDLSTLRIGDEPLVPATLARPHGHAAATAACVRACASSRAGSNAPA